MNSRFACVLARNAPAVSFDATPRREYVLYETPPLRSIGYVRDAADGAVR